MNQPASSRIARTSTFLLVLAIPLLLVSGRGTADVAAVSPAASTLAAGASGAGASPQGVEVLGTIEATVDGRRMTWYSVAGESGGKPYSSSTWMELSATERMVALGGFSTDDPPLESFEWDDAGMPASYGTYEGSVFAIAIRLASDQAGFTTALPDHDRGTHLSYQPRATFQDVMASTLMAATGTLTVEDAAITDGLARAEGTFSGTFRAMSGEGSVEITDGVFRVEGVPAVETLRR